MATFTYNGLDERVFPSISVIVQPGESFEAPDDFSVADVTPAAATKKAAAAPTTAAPTPANPSTSAASDPAVGA